MAVNWAFRPGQAVHVPFGFLRGERLGGTVQALHARFDGGELDMATVSWADGEVTREHFCDLAPGAQPQECVESFRLAGLFRRSTGGHE